MTYAHDTRTNAARTAKSAADNVAATASEYAQRAGEKLEEVKQGAEELASDALERGREAGRQLDEVAGNMKTAVHKSVRDQPMATLAVAAITGFVLGAIWKS